MGKRYQTAKIEVAFDCPFCGRSCASSNDMMFHAEPPCQVFLDLDPLEFLEAVNDKNYGDEGRTLELQAKRVAFDAKDNGKQ